MQSGTSPAEEVSKDHERPRLVQWKLVGRKCQDDIKLNNYKTCDGRGPGDREA